MADEGIEYRDNAKHVAALVARFNEVLSAPMSDALEAAGWQWRGAMVKRFRRRSGNYWSPEPGTIGRRSSRLLQSLGHRTHVGVKLGAVALTLFSAGSPYARMQEYGGIIRPRTGKMLAIPGEDNLMGTGLPRYPSARAWFDVALRSQKQGDAEVIMRRSKNGNSVRVEFKSSASADPKHMWTLVRKVTIKGPKTGYPSRLGMRDTWRDLGPARAKLIGKRLADSISKMDFRTETGRFA